jgi:hypothetical protein
MSLGSTLTTQIYINCGLSSHFGNSDCVVAINLINFRSLSPLGLKTLIISGLVNVSGNKKKDVKFAYIHGLIKFISQSQMLQRRGIV